jgi:hypothetical protein
MSKTAAAFAAVLSFTLAGSALAQNPQATSPATPPGPPIVRGTVVELKDNVLTLKSEKDGKPMQVTLAQTWSVSVMKPVAIDAIQPGSFIGTTNMPTGEGAGESLEVHVFPPGVKMGEGHYGWDLKPGSMMTNGTVGKVVSGKKGSRELEVAYNGSGLRHITVPAKVPVVQITPGARELVKPGIPVFMVVRKNPDGSMATGGVSVGENGAKPPM